ncbi:Hypothetical_protein [Hexamita inflata]|uniref:Hypothetical_protein n=1 Tax=Hexamita inflata TaxID=28002 RepID=A0AA86NT02_9EUKA|nr:Hypothetical protein HINF_LOCUS12769 [Hexamita inflata]
MSAKPTQFYQHVTIQDELNLRNLSQIKKQLGYLRGIKTVMFSPHSQCVKLTMCKLKYDGFNSNTFIYEWCWALDIYTQINNIIGKQSKLFQFKFLNIRFQMSFCQNHEFSKQQYQLQKAI